MSAVTICSDFVAPQNSLSLFPLFPHLFAMLLLISLINLNINIQHYVHNVLFPLMKSNNCENIKRSDILICGLFLSYMALLVPQMVKNLPVIHETRFPSQGQENPMDKGRLMVYNPWGNKEPDMIEWLTLYHIFECVMFFS